MATALEETGCKARTQGKTFAARNVKKWAEYEHYQMNTTWTSLGSNANNFTWKPVSNETYLDKCRIPMDLQWRLKWLRAQHMLRVYQHGRKFTLKLRASGQFLAQIFLADYCAFQKVNLCWRAVFDIRNACESTSRIKASLMHSFVPSEALGDRRKPVCCRVTCTKSWHRIIGSKNHDPVTTMEFHTVSPIKTNPCRCPGILWNLDLQQRVMGEQNWPKGERMGTDWGE